MFQNLHCVKSAARNQNCFDLKLAPRINRFLLTESGERVQSYSMKIGQLNKVINVPESPVTLYNDKLPEELPKNLNKQAYLDLIENVYSHWI